MALYRPAQRRANALPAANVLNVYKEFSTQVENTRYGRGFTSYHLTNTHYI